MNSKTISAFYFFLGVLLALSFLITTWFIASSDAQTSNLILSTTDFTRFDEEGKPAGTYQEIKEAIPVEVQDNDIVKLRQEDSQTFYTGRGTLITKFYPGQNFYYDNGVWLHVEYSVKPKPISFLDWFLNSANAQSTTTSVFYSIDDGYMGSNVNGGSWDGVHDATYANGGDDTSDNEVRTYDVSGRFIIYRSYLIFRTGLVIPDNAIIASSSLIVEETYHSVGDDDGDDFVNIVNFNPADATNISWADYDNFGATNTPEELSNRIDISDSINGWVAFPLNTTDVIAKEGDTFCDNTHAGYTCLGVREGHDILDDPILATKYNVFHFNNIEEAGTTNDPYLLVEWSTTTEETPPEEYSSACEPDDIDDITFVTSCSYDSTTGITYTNYRASGIIVLIIYILVIFISYFILDFYISRIEKWTRL